MIYIKEAKSQQINTLTSLYISFDYNSNIISILKSIDVYYYNNTNYTWELPINKLAYIIDNLVYIDNITLVLLKEDNTINTNLLCSYRFTPFEHQIEAVKYGLSHNRWLLLDAPGLGKTASIIMLAEELKLQKNIKHCLIICGINSLKSNWEKEINKLSHLDSIIIGKHINSKGNISYTSINDRVKQLSQPIKEFFVIINIESLRDKRIIKAINNFKFDFIAFDEAHKANSTKSQQGENLQDIQAPYMVAMTGTLLTNSPLNTYVPLVWLDIFKKRSLTKFKNLYCILDDNIKGKIIGYKNIDLLKDTINRCSLRRNKELLNLPTKNIINTYIDMDRDQQTLYNSIVNKTKEECNLVDLNTTNSLAIVTRLRQATSCPSVLTDKPLKNAKLEYCVDLINQLVEQNEKAVIVSSFKEPIYKLKELLTNYKLLLGTGDMADNDVSKNVDLFQQDDSYKIFLGTTQKMGTGITLNAASYMILIDMPWTASEYEQITDRIHRIGTTRPVFIYNLICSSTIDEKVVEVVNRKSALSDYIIDDKTSNIQALKDYITNL